MTDITVTTHPAQRIVSLRRQIDTYQCEAEAWQQFIAEAQGQGVAFADAPCGATFHDEEFRESDIDIEVWMPVPGDVVAMSPLTVREVLEQKVAVATFRGDYSQFGEQIGALAGYIAATDLQVTGPMYNRYLIGPGRTQDPAQYVTEICMPVA